MPACQLHQQSPSDLLQLCGVKRKAELSSEVDYLCRPGYDQPVSSKRICLCPEKGFNSFDCSLTWSSSNHKEISYSCDCAKSQPVLGTSHEVRVATCDMHPMPQFDSLQSVGEASFISGFSTESQMMDNMEVDCNALEHQMPYKQTSIQELRNTIDRQFCEDYCGLGSVSPASGLLRCFCRPSWEGMVEMQSYRSDFY